MSRSRKRDLEEEEEEEGEDDNETPKTKRRPLPVSFTLPIDSRGRVVSKKKKKGPPPSLLKRLQRKTRDPNERVTGKGRYYKRPKKVTLLPPKKKPMSYYKRQQKKELGDRIEFLLGSHHSNLIFNLPNGRKIRLFQCFFPEECVKRWKGLQITENPAVMELDIGKGTSSELYTEFLTENLLMNVLLGERTKLTTNQLLGLGVFFQEIEHYQGVYVVCHQIKLNRDITHQLLTLRDCKMLFEKPSEDSHIPPSSKFFEDYEDRVNSAWSTINDKYNVEELPLPSRSKYFSDPRHSVYRSSKRGFPIRSPFTLCILQSLKERSNEVLNIRMYVDYLEQLGYLSYMVMESNYTLEFSRHPFFRLPRNYEPSNDSPTSSSSTTTNTTTRRRGRTKRKRRGAIDDNFGRFGGSSFESPGSDSTFGFYGDPFGRDVVRRFISQPKKKKKIDNIRVNTISDDFPKMFIGRLREMYSQRKRTGNLTLYTDDYQQFKVHKEILILKSNMIYKLLKFPGREHMEEREKLSLKIEVMSSLELQCFIEFMYTGKITKMTDYQILIRLVEISEMFFEYYFQEYLFQKISSKLMIDFEGNRLEITLIKHGHLFKKLPEELMNRFFDRLVLKKEVVDNLVKLSEDNKSQFSRIKKVEKEKERTIDHLRKVIMEKERKIQRLSSLINKNNNKEEDDEDENEGEESEDENEGDM